MWQDYTGPRICALEEVLKAFQPDEAYYWATYNRAEIDPIMFKQGKRTGVEFKRVDAPTITPSIRTAIQDLKLAKVSIIYPGDKKYPLADNVEAVPLVNFVGTKTF